MKTSPSVSRASKRGKTPERDAWGQKTLASISQRLKISLPIEAHFYPSYGRYERERRGRMLFLHGVQNRVRVGGLDEPKFEQDLWTMREEVLNADPDDFEMLIVFYGRFADGVHEIRGAADKPLDEG